MEYHHQPSQAASSFSRTATAERYSKRETHKFSRSLIDNLNNKRCIRPSGYAQVPEDNYIIPTDRSPQRNRPISPRQRHFRPSSSENNTTSKFSESILRSNSTRHPALQDLSVLRAARADWTESDEQLTTNRRPLSMSSIIRKKSVDMSHMCALNSTRIRDDNESVYRGRSFCIF